MSIKNLDISNEDYAKCSACIDYFEFIIYEEFNEDSLTWAKLSSYLHIDPYGKDEVFERSNKWFRVVNLYDANIYVHSEARTNDGSPDEEKKFKVQMAGQACREFEMRNGKWSELFECVQSFKHSIKRIDLALDDFYYMNLEELKEFIREKWYISNFRRTAKIREKKADKALNYLFENIESDEPLFYEQEQREGKSYSATFGETMGSECALQIYDKFQERKHAGYDLLGNQWIRFEMRFKNNKADVLFVKLLDSIKNNYFYSLCAQLLYGLIDFKGQAFNYNDSNHYYRLSTWKPYLDFIGGFNDNDKIKIKAPEEQIDIERIMARKEAWIKKYVAKSLLMLKISMPDDFDDLITAYMAEQVSASKLTYSDLCIINYSRIFNGEKPFTQDEVFDYLKRELNMQEKERKCRYSDSYNFYDSDDLPF